MSTSAQQRHPSLGPPAAPVTLQTPGQEERSQLCPCPRRTLPDSRLSAKRADPGCRLGGLRLDGKMGAAGDQVAHFFSDCQTSGLRRRDQPRVHPPLPQQLVRKPPTSRPRRVDGGAPVVLDVKWLACHARGGTCLLMPFESRKAPSETSASVDRAQLDWAPIKDDGPRATPVAGGRSSSAWPAWYRPAPQPRIDP